MVICSSNYHDLWYPYVFMYYLYRGSYIHVHVLPNLLRVGKKDKMQGYAEHLIGFPQLY